MKLETNELAMIFAATFPYFGWAVRLSFDRGCSAGMCLRSCQPHDVLIATRTAHGQVKVRRKLLITLNNLLLYSGFPVLFLLFVFHNFCQAAAPLNYSLYFGQRINRKFEI
jgi:hypothetical protein